MEQEIRRKIEETEEIYRKNRVVLENHLDYLSNEQRKFQRYLENISVQINATALNIMRPTLPKIKGQSIVS